ncbi:hypothetical protein CFD26_108514 [Aspergillus turcosus]|uniref:Uncharacterized protein n=1 Tax=Aspergillus turcosus TaxID=1245748 RepID=A0A3R7J818_9EURO|nr:hypothetical protein CFD26_108514 [Aspergillus turcosus]
MDRKNIMLSFIDPQFYELHNDEVVWIIHEDMGADAPIEMFIIHSFPQVYAPLPLTEEAINKLETLEGLDIEFLDGEDDLL